MARQHAHAHETPGHGHGHGHDHEHDAHIPVGTYHVVFGALMLLLILTLAAAAVDVGWLNLPIALLIAVVKAGLVMAYFMHLRVSTRLVVLFATGTFFWLAILFVLTMADYYARQYLPIQ